MRKKALGGIGFGGLTPLLDTLFILLFALLVTSEAKTADATTEEIRVRLPEVEEGEEAGASSESIRLTLEIDADSVVMLGAEAMETREALDAAVAEQLGDALPEEVTIELFADRDARHGVLVELLQYFRLRGFVDIQLLATGDAGDSRFGGDE